MNSFGSIVLSLSDQINLSEVATHNLSCRDWAIKYIDSKLNHSMLNLSIVDWSSDSIGG